MKTKTTFVSSRTAIAKVWKRKGKKYYRSPFGLGFQKVKQVPEGHYVKYVSTDKNSHD